MNMELTKEQYKTLLKLMYCGEWVFKSYKIGEDKIYKETDQFEQYIFSFAKGYKLDQWIEYDEESRKYFPTLFMENSIHKYVDIYNQRQRKL
jgi:hypothetical protein